MALKTGVQVWIVAPNEDLTDLIIFLKKRTNAFKTAQDRDWRQKVGPITGISRYC